VLPPDTMAHGRDLLEKAAQAAEGEQTATQRVAFLRTGLRDAELTLEALRAFRAYENGPGDSTSAAYAQALRKLETHRHENEHSGFANLYYLAFRENRIWDRSLILVREHTVPLPRTWKFMWDPGETGQKEGWHMPGFNDRDWLDIGTDSPWEKQPAGQAWKQRHGQDYNGIAWYRVRFSVRPDQRGKRLALLFGAVDEGCTIWVNGREVLTRVFDAAKKPNSWAEAFEVQLNDLAPPGQENVIAVRVEDRAGAGGIWKPVWLGMTDQPDHKGNRLRNPGFEDPLKGDQNWYFISYMNEKGDTYSVTRDRTTPHSGSYAMKIVAAAPADGRLVQKIPDVDPTKLYQLVIRWRTSTDFKGKIGVHIGSRVACGATHGSWQELILPNVPAPREKLYLGFWVNKCTGTVWFDDIQLTSMPDR